jgi:hypothetical protein
MHCLQPCKQQPPSHLHHVSSHQSSNLPQLHRSLQLQGHLRHLGLNCLHHCHPLCSLPLLLVHPALSTLHWIAILQQPSLHFPLLLHHQHWKQLAHRSQRHSLLATTQPPRHSRNLWTMQASLRMFRHLLHLHPLLHLRLCTHWCQSRGRWGSRWTSCLCCSRRS